MGLSVMSKCTNCGSEFLLEYENGYYCRDCKSRVSYDELTELDCSQRHKTLLKALKKSQARVVITAAQNNTDPHLGFLRALKSYCRHNKAELVIIPYRYRNSASREEEKKAKATFTWDAALQPYLLDKRFEVNKNFTVLAEIKLQPTNSRPMSGLETITGKNSGVVGHSKQELISIATPQSKLAKIMCSTGAITKPIYLETKAGAKAKFHHTYGALVVEKNQEKFYLRQLDACKDGSFIDLDREYHADGHITKTQALALVLGDLHYEFLDPQVKKATFDGPNSMLGVLKPKYRVFHDAWDGYSISHHHEHQHFVRYFKHLANRDDPRASLQEFFKFIDDLTPKNVVNIFPASNHPDFLFKWVNQTDWREDINNAHFLVDTTLAIMNQGASNETGVAIPDPFKIWAKQFMQTYSQARFLARDESFLIGGIEVALHGDRGANGSQGNISQTAKMGVKSITGHTHSLAIRDGCYQVGTSSYLKLDYARSSPTSWLNGHCVIYRNGKRSLLVILPNGSWRLE